MKPVLLGVPNRTVQLIDELEGTGYRGPFYQHGLTLIAAWITNYSHCKVCYEITYS